MNIKRVKSVFNKIHFGRFQANNNLGDFRLLSILINEKMSYHDIDIKIDRFGFNRGFRIFEVLSYDIHGFISFKPYDVLLAQYEVSVFSQTFKM